MYKSKIECTRSFGHYTSLLLPPQEGVVRFLWYAFGWATKGPHWALGPQISKSTLFTLQNSILTINFHGPKKLGCFTPKLLILPPKTPLFKQIYALPPPSH